MKKGLLALGAGLFPYAVLFSIRFVEHMDGPLLLGIWFLFWLIGFACALAIFQKSRREKWPAADVALLARSVKLFQVPAYLLFFCGGLFFFVVWAFALVVFLIDVMTIILSGLVGLAAVRRCEEEGLLNRRQALIHGILQFIFCADVVSAVILDRKAVKAE